MRRPVIEGKWWSHSKEEWALYNENAQKSFSHVGRIMETKLGGRVPDDKRCASCVSMGRECHTYTEVCIKTRQVKIPGLSCAWCRQEASVGGCTFVNGSTPKRPRNKSRVKEVEKSSSKRRKLAPKPAGFRVRYRGIRVVDILN